MARGFADRIEAGRQLADVLAKRDWSDPLVLALPRGGVPVGFEVARRLGCPLDVLVVRKIGVPGHRELAMGAVASGGTVVRNTEVVRAVGVGERMFEEATSLALDELRRREEALRGVRAFPAVAGKTVLVVDDGMATGSTMRAAVEALRAVGAGTIVVAVPVASPEAVVELESVADEVVALITPGSLRAVGLWYRRFDQTSDDEVRRLLAAASG